jgi:OTU domain-containing protein 3
MALLTSLQRWEHYSSVRNMAGPHTGHPQVHVVPEMISKKRPSPSIDGDDDDQLRRARKRRSPLPLFDSDSTPEGTDSSSDESNGPMLSQQSHLDIPAVGHNVKPQKLTIKLRGLRTTDHVDSPTPSRTSSPAPQPAAPLLQDPSLLATSPVAESTPPTAM